MPAPGAARSFWLQEALTDDPGDRCPPLTAKVSADVCIVGAGFTGLDRDRALREGSGLRIALVEQDICGGGARSQLGILLVVVVGRAGHVRALRRGRGAALPAHGRRHGPRGGRVVEANGVDAWFHHEGTMRVATGPWQTDVDETSAAAFLEARGLAIDCGRSCSTRLGRSPTHPDSPRRGSVPTAPSSSRRGSREACVVSRSSEGPHLRADGDDRARSFAAVGRAHDPRRGEGSGCGARDRRVGGWLARLRRSFGVIADHLVATEPIPDRLEEIGWTSQVGIGDGREPYYLRPTDDGRIVIGGGALSVVFGGRAGGERPRTTSVLPRPPPEGCSGSSRSWRASGSPTRGADRSTRPPRSCRSSARSSPVTCTRAWGSPGTGYPRRCWAGASSPRWCWASTTSGPRCRSSGPRRSRRPNHCASRRCGSPRGRSRRATVAPTRVGRGHPAGCGRVRPLAYRDRVAKRAREAVAADQYRSSCGGRCSGSCCASFTR